MAKFQKYQASLRGANSSAFHINKLKLHSSFRVIVEERADSFQLQIIDKVREIPDKEIKSAITEREKKLKLNVPNLAKRTSEDIQSAFKAEQIVKEGALSICMLKREKNTTSELTLTVMPDEEDLHIVEICDHYAYIRIRNVADALDMTIDGYVIKL